MSKISIVHPLESHNFASDNRVLIPFLQYQRYGFMDKSKNVVVGPKYDFILDSFYQERSLVRVGVFSCKAYIGKGGEVTSYPTKLLGLLDSKGELIFKCEYVTILISDDSEYITLHHPVHGHSLVDRYGNTIIPYGVYNFIDGADHNLARVYVVHPTTHKKCWGIVDTSGRVALPLEYSNIWNFHEKDMDYTTVEKDGVSKKVFFKSLISSGISNQTMHIMHQEDYGRHYGEFAGSYAQDVMGYSDDVINDAFEGDPDAYWNID